MSEKQSPNVISLREFARLAGVSPMTVSRVYSDKSNVASSTREKILSLAKQLNFHPPAVRPSSRDGKTRSVGVLSPGYAGSYFLNISQGIQNELITLGYLPIMLTVTAKNFRACLSRLIEHRVDGVIFQNLCDPLFHPDIKKLEKLKIPFVSLGKVSSGLNCDYVMDDDYAGGHLAAKHFLEHGHRRFIVVQSNSDRDFGRIDGFIAAVDESGFSDAEVFKTRHHLKDEDGYNVEDAVAHLTTGWRSRSDTTAIFAGNDYIALDVIAAGRVLGLEVAKDYSLIGCGDLAFAARMSPALTTVRQDGITLGAEAARLLISRFEGYAGPARKIEIGLELVERQSVRDVRGSK